MRSNNVWVRFTNLTLLQEVIGRGPGIRRRIPCLCPTCWVWLAAMLFSLARPEAVVAVPREQAAVILAIYISGSMSATDLDPSSMEAAKQPVQTFVDGRPD